MSYEEASKQALGYAVEWAEKAQDGTSEVQRPEDLKFDSPVMHKITLRVQMAQLWLSVSRELHLREVSR